MSCSREPAESLVGLEDVRRAAERLRGVVRRTPLLPVDLPDGDGRSAEDPRHGSGGPAAGHEYGPASAEASGRPGGSRRPGLWLKCESLQHAGAFKVRGAYNFVSLLTGGERDAGLITFSSGNHAQGVAFAAREYGCRALIVMPEDAPRSKVEGTLGLGAEVVQEGYTSSEREEKARELAAEEGYTIVPPFDHVNIVAGQGTVGLEIAEQLREAAVFAGGDPGGPGARPALVLVPIGGGGLISGTAAALAELAAGARVVGVEPDGAPSMRRSLDAGRPVELERVDTIADGLKPVRPGRVTFHHVRELVDDVVTVTDEAIRAAVVWCLERKLVVEPSGAATVAALASGRVTPASAEAGATVAVISGGNVDTDLLCGWLSAS